METLLEDLPTPTLMGVLGFATGIAFGYIARLHRFCTLSAIESALYGGAWLQARMWALAIAVAVLCTHGLHASGLIDLTQSFHLLPRIMWFSPIIGGLLFGLGMAAVGTCGFGALLRAGGGDMRGMVVVLVIGVTGYMTMRGLLGMPRAWLADAQAIALAEGWDASLTSLAAWASGYGVAEVRMPVALTVSGLIALWCLGDRQFRRNRRSVFAGAAIGGLITFGWFATGYLGQSDFDPQPLASLGFVAPVGDSLLYLMTFTGSAISFGIASVLGTMLGAVLAAWRKHELRMDAFDDVREMRRHLLGAVLMGVGGVLAMGCTIGQGLSGVSTLAIPSFFALGSIVAGAVLGLRILVAGGGSWLSGQAFRWIR